MKTIVKLLIYFLSGVHALFANDVAVNIVDKESQKPIEAVIVCWQLLSDKSINDFDITNTEGRVYLPLEVGTKVLISASYVGYKTVVDTVTLQRTNNFSLEQDVFDLGQVVITGHNKPTSIESSLYGVRVIGKQKIQSSGATSLADLFLTEPNISLSTDPILGTKLEMFGMSGRNVKVMIDGVPVIGRMNGQIDLSQLTVDNIERIEIIEGPMSVVYGNNALAGTINIITHKSTYFDTDASVSVGLESVGRYDGALDISQKIGKSTLALSGNYSNFTGVDFDKDTRSMEWKPQQQYNVSLGYRLKQSDWDIEAKVSAYQNKITMKGDVHHHKVYDASYFTDRYSGAINLKGNWNEKNNLTILLSHSYYNRSSQDETKDLTTLEVEKEKKVSSQKEGGTVLRTVWNHTFIPSILSLESGLDFNLSSMKGRRIKDDKQNLNDYAAFLSVRYHLWKNFEIQPGLRFAYNTAYDSPILYSFNAKWKITEALALRGSVAKGYRAPTVKELYYVFVDSNHRIYGNENLKPEKSNNYSISLDYKLKWKRNYLRFISQFFYNDFDNLISLVEMQNVEGYKYDNISRYKTRGGNIGATFFHKDILQLNVSTILTDRYNNLSKISGGSRFTTTVDWIAGLQLKEPVSRIKLNADIKLYGERSYFYYGGNSQIKETSRSPYEILNASINRGFLKDRLNITLGAKNIMNVKTVKLSGKTGGGGHSSANGTLIGYGTSFFLKASFRLTN